ncbi:MAG: class I tRNA ligase family protein [Candidatus Berkelbacteria bacterium]|nr:class I tRNA ligase family protein [Candidatus Berkelbacteria bacterium]
MKYITTPIYYINDKPHLGHAYTTIAADVLARYYRNRGQKVFFLVGTDEHGLKVQKAAEKEGIEPKAFADKMAALFQETWKKLDVGCDFFIRTTDTAHEKYVKDFATKLYRKGDIYKDTYRGLYCIGCEAYIQDDDLVDGKCLLHNQAPQKIEEDVYFFRLSKYQEHVKKVIETDIFRIEPKERKNEVLGFINQEGGLKDVAISRSKVKWGIPLPWDKEHVFYVWFDALLNYLSALKITGIKAWPPDIQLMAKDVLRFHALLWPAMLSAGEESLPKKIFVHGYFTIEGKKMSKTLGNVIDPLRVAEKYGTGPLRYFLLREFPFGEDGDYSDKNLIKRYNSELADDLGNLLQRTLVMINRFKIKVTKKHREIRLNGIIEDKIEALDFQGALTEINRTIKGANAFIDKEKPWELVDNARKSKEIGLETDEKTRFDEIFVHLISTLHQVAYYLEPFMPREVLEIQRQLKNLKPEPIFPKIKK